MLIRKVTLKLKSDSTQEFSRIIENDILPLLRKHEGFRDEVALIAPERSEALGISFWDKKENAEAYNSTGYPETLKALAKVVDGTPTVETFELSNSTFHKLAAKGA